MEKPQQKPRLSRYVSTLLFLSIVYAPTIPFVLSAGDIDWTGMYANEAFTWMMILSGLDILIIITACKIFRTSPVFAVITVLLSLIPLTWALCDYFEAGGIILSSKLDTDPIGGMASFWYEGGGYLMGVLTIPLAIWYIVLLIKENTRQQVNSTSQP